MKNIKLDTIRQQVHTDEESGNAYFVRLWDVGMNLNPEHVGEVAKGMRIGSTSRLTGSLAVRRVAPDFWLVILDDNDARTTGSNEVAVGCVYA